MKIASEATLTAILPENLLADEKIAALAKSLDNELQKLTAETRLPLHLPRLEELPHDVLNALAWGYHCDFF